MGNCMWYNGRTEKRVFLHNRKISPSSSPGSCNRSIESLGSQSTELEIERAQSRITYLMEQCGKHNQNCHEMKKHFADMAGRIILLEKRQNQLVKTLRSVGIEI